MTLTTASIDAARARNAANSEAVSLYQPKPFPVTDYEMMISGAIDALDYVVRVAGFSIERPELGYTREHARDVFSIDVATKVWLANNRVAAGTMKRREG